MLLGKLQKKALRNLKVCCQYRLLFFNIVHKFSGSAIKFFTFGIRSAEMSVWENVEGFLLVSVWQRYLESIIKGKVGLSLGEQTFLSCVFVNIESRDCAVCTGNQLRNSGIKGWVV